MEEHNLGVVRGGTYVKALVRLFATVLDYAAPDLSIGAVMEAISRAWWRGVARVECLGGTCNRRRQWIFHES
jgi:hypothetical protein